MSNYICFIHIPYNADNYFRKKLIYDDFEYYRKYSHLVFVPKSELEQKIEYRIFGLSIKESKTYCLYYLPEYLLYTDDIMKYSSLLKKNFSKIRNALDINRRLLDD